MPPGSKADPVVLDPMQTIVEVGWNTVTHLAFPLTVQRRSVIKDYAAPYRGVDETPTGEQPVDWQIEEEPSPEPGGIDHDNHWYVTGWQYEYAGLTPHSGYGLRSGAWQAMDFDGAPSNLPVMPIAHSVGTWQYLFEVIISSDSVMSWWPRAEFQALAGSTVPDIVVPLDAGIPFKTGTSATIRMRGSAFTSSATTGDVADKAHTPSSTDPVQAKYATTAPHSPGTGEGITDYFGDSSLDFANVVVLRNNKAYRAFALALRPPTGSAPTTAGEVWVLCQRSKADDPS